MLRIRPTYGLDFSPARPTSTSSASLRCCRDSRRVFITLRGPQATLRDLEVRLTTFRSISRHWEKYAALGTLPAALRFLAAQAGLSRRSAGFGRAEKRA